MEQIEKTPATIANAEKDHDYWTTKFGDVPSYKTAGEAEQSGIPSLGSSMDEIAKQLGGELVKEAPKCDHGHRIWRESKPGAPKVWAGYFCSEREKANQCQPFWYVVGTSGKWSPQL